MVDIPNPNAISLPRDKKQDHELEIRRFECVLLLPVFLQWERNASKQVRPREADPQHDPDFLNTWIAEITSSGHWKESTAPYPPLFGASAEPAYSEFCYFHPFVRNFLYVNRDDLRTHWNGAPKNKRPDSADGASWESFVSSASNRTLRLLQRTDLEGATLLADYEQELIPNTGNWRNLRTTFEISNCWMYLFDTQVAMISLRLVAETTAEVSNLDGTVERMPLTLRQVLRLQDAIRRSYSSYWSIFSIGNSTLHSAGHCLKALTLRFPATTPAPSKTTSPTATVAPETRREIVSRFGSFTSQTESVADLERTPAVRTSKEAAITSPSTSPGSDAARGESTTESLSSIQGRHEAEEYRKHVFLHREPLVNSVWQEILSPIVPTQFEKAVKPSGSDANHSRLHFEMIGDERIPLLSFIAVDDPRSITKADWIRLAYADDEGRSNIYPYSPEFQKNEILESVAYDRFFHPTGSAQSRANSDMHQTRWLCCGYAFVGVGPNESGFFLNEHSGALAHFRHHYFALALIAQFHRASLLRLKHELAEASDELLGHSAISHSLLGQPGIWQQLKQWFQALDQGHEVRMVKFRTRVKWLTQQLERFRARYWFVEVSNQIQGQELFNLFKSHLNLEPLMSAVSTDAEGAGKLVQSWHEEHRNESTHTLALLGAWAIALVPFLDYLKTELLNQKRHRFENMLALSMTVAGLICLSIPLLYNRYSLSRRIIGAAFLLTGLIIMVCYQYEPVIRWLFPTPDNTP